VRSCEKLPLCLIKIVPASSKTDPPMAKAKPISDSSSTYLCDNIIKKGEKKRKPAVRWQ